jgi:hypothetical protein
MIMIYNQYSHNKIRPVKFKVFQLYVYKTHKNLIYYKLI